MELEKIKAKIAKINDGNKLDEFLTHALAECDDCDYDVIIDYAEDRRAEIEAERNPSKLDYPCYRHDNNFRIASQSWRNINPHNYSYWQWLEDVGLPQFWMQPRPELQHKLLAICCAINSNAIPPRNQSAQKEMALPLLYFYGLSGSGKTEGNKIIAMSYPTERNGLIMANSSGTSLRNMCHNICYRGFRDANPGYNNLFPGYLLIDNYEPEYLKKWGEFKMVLLSVLRSQSYAQIANENRDNDYFYTHLLKSFTSVIPPKAMSTAQSEFARRFVYFFTEKSEEIRSIAKYDFSEIPKIYARLWNMEDVGKKWYPLLSKLLAMDDNETTVPPNRWAQSLCIMATGVYANLFDDLSHAYEFMTEYWSWVEGLEQDMTNEVATLMDNMIAEAIQVWLDTEGSSIGLSPQMGITRFPKLLISDIHKRINSGVLAKRGALEDAKNYLSSIKQWVYHVEKVDGNLEMFYYLPWKPLCQLIPDLRDFEDD